MVCGANADEKAFLLYTSPSIKHDLTSSISREYRLFQTFHYSVGLSQRCQQIDVHGGSYGLCDSGLNSFQRPLHQKSIFSSNGTGQVVK